MLDTTTGIEGITIDMTELMAIDTETTDGDKSPRTRLIVDADDELNAAVQLRASKRSVAERRRVSKSEVVTSILRQELVPEIEELRSYSKGAAKKKPTNGGGARKP